MAAAPEVGIPLQLGKQLAPHAPLILMMPLVVFAIIFVIIGIIALSVATNKVTGIMFSMLGLLLGGGALFIMAKTESHKA